MRWKAAYCMALNETDDLENEGVSRCLYAADPPRLKKSTACDRNAYWKTELCRLAHPNDSTAVSACVADEKTTPQFIERGQGRKP